MSLRRRLNHLLRRTKSASSVGPEVLDTSETVHEEGDKLETVDDNVVDVYELGTSIVEEEEEEGDGGALSLADLESEQLSPFVTRHAGSTPKVPYLFQLWHPVFGLRMNKYV